MMSKRLLVCALAVAALATVGRAPAAEKGKQIHLDESKLPPPVQKQGVTYESDIKPLFDHSCVKCHGPQKPKGHLRLDSLEGVFKGSEDGKVLVPGHSNQSMLIANVAHLGDPDDYMPPPKNKAGIPPLTKEQIGLLRAWIDQGAK